MYCDLDHCLYVIFCKTFNTLHKLLIVIRTIRVDLSIGKLRKKKTNQKSRDFHDFYLCRLALTFPDAKGRRAVAKRHRRTVSFLAYSPWFRELPFTIGRWLLYSASDPT